MADPTGLSKGSIGSLVVYFEGDTKDLDNAIKDANKKHKKYADDTDSRNKRLADSWKRGAAVASAAVVGTVAAINKFAKAAAEIQNLSNRLGISIEKFQELQIVARDTGVSIDTLNATFIKLNQGITQISQGQITPLSQALEAMGIAVQDSAGKLRSSTDVFNDVADKFKSYEDSAKKSALAVQLFGEQGAQLLPILNKGSDGLKKLSDEAKKSGQILDQQTIKQAAEVNNELNKLADVVTKAGIQITASFLPAIKALREWLMDNQLINGLTTFGNKVGEVIDNIKRLEKERGGFERGSQEAVNRTATRAFLQSSIKDLQEHLAMLEEGKKNAFEKGVDTSLWEQQIIKVNQEIAETNRAIKDIQEGVGGPAQPFRPLRRGGSVRWPEPAGEEAPSEFKNAQEEIDAMREAARRAMDDIVSSPTETIANKIKAITEAVKDGTISFGEFNASMKAVNDEGQSHMDDLLTATRGVLDSLFKDNKAAAIASAIVNTYQGITKALAAYPPPVSYAMAAAQAAMGFAQVRAIKSTSKSTSSGSMASGGGSTGGGANSGNQQGGEMSRTMYVRGIGPNELFTGEVLKTIATGLLQYQKDGGKVVI